MHFQAEVQETDMAAKEKNTIKSILNIKKRNYYLPLVFGYDKK